MFYYDILEGIHARGVRCLIVGGLAVNLHDVPRMTNDIDLILDLDPGNVRTFVGMLNDLGYVPRLPVSPELLADAGTRAVWTGEKNMKAFSFYHARDQYKVVDVVLVHPLDFAAAYGRAERRTVRDIEIRYAALDDLITMKTAAGRPQDIRDAALLKQARKTMEDGHDR